MIRNKNWFIQPCLNRFEVYNVYVLLSTPLDVVIHSFDLYSTWKYRSPARLSFVHIAARAMNQIIYLSGNRYNILVFEAHSHVARVSQRKLNCIHTERTTAFTCMCVHTHARPREVQRTSCQLREFLVPLYHWHYIIIVPRVSDLRKVSFLDHSAASINIGY